MQSGALSQCVTAWATRETNLQFHRSQVSQQFQGEPVSLAVAVTALVSLDCAMCHESWQPEPKDSMQPAFPQETQPETDVALRRLDANGR
eukprot:s1031_g13.t1